MFCLSLLGIALAQSPEEPWKTVQTAHFRLHYPADTEAWALYAGERLDAIRAIVSEEVGFSPTQTVEIVVMDPFAQANGFAIPLLGSPRMGVFPTAPDPASGIGHYRTWAEELIVHEDAHLVHLLRPSRNPALNLAMQYLGMGPVTLNSPAWVVEGYATVVEGRLTGLGRPNSNARAAFLRSLAHDGDFPAYEELDLPDRYSAGSYRYLVGSAYLEWLVARSHEGALRDLWARMTAKEIRSFEEAFVGVFGDEPDILYRRFVAEMTFEAMAIEVLRPEDPNTLFQDFEYSTAPPTISPDGSRLALLQRGESGPLTLSIYPTDPGEDPQTNWEEANLPDLEADPEDVAPVAPAVYPMEAETTLTLGGRRPAHPRWLDDDTIVFTDFRTGPSGDAHPELVSWQISTNTLRNITQNQHVRDADPHGDVAYALHSQHGLSALVMVSLTDGAVEPLTDSQPDVVYAQPRISPDGTRLAWLANRGEGWGIEWADVSQGALAEHNTLPLPDTAEVLTVDWDPDGDLLATLGRGGFLEAYSLSLDGQWQQLTHSRSGALYPVATPDNSAIFYLQGDRYGLDLHRMNRADAQDTDLDDASVRELMHIQTSVLRPTPPPAAPHLDTAEVTGTPYRARPQFQALLGDVIAPAQSNTELGIVLADVIGRHELVMLASIGDRVLIGPDTGYQFRGARMAYTWRRLPVRIKLDGAYLDFNGLAAQVWMAAHGDHSRQWNGGGLHARLGAVGQTNTMEFFAAPEARVTVGHRVWLGKFWLGGGVDSRGMVDMVELGAYTTRNAVTVGGGLSDVALQTTVEHGLSDRGFSLGGVAEPLLPEPAATDVIWAPGLAYGTVTQSADLLRYRADINVMGAVNIFGERHVMAEGSLPYTQTGIAAKLPIPPQPLIGTAGLALQLGVACLVETPEGWASDPCEEGEDWSGWLALQIMPGQEFPIP